MSSRPDTGAAPATSDRLRLGAGVFLVAEDGVARLLDFDRGRFYALDPVGSALLALALTHGMDRAAHSAAARFRVPLARVRADLAALHRGLERRRLLLRKASSDGRRSARLWRGFTGLVRLRPWRGGARLPSCWTIAVHLVLAWTSLRLLGWLRTLELWRRYHQPAPASTPLTAAQLEQLDQRLRAVAAGLILPMNCKERALALHQILRARYGVPASLVVGIQRHPFAAHAWVECGGQVLTDDAARCATFTPVARYA